MGRKGLGAPLGFAIAATIILWASAFPGIRVGLAAYGGGELALLRSLVASGAFALHAAIARPRLPAVSDWPRIAVLGAAGIAGYNVALNLGQRTVAAGAASFLVATVPLFTALLASLLLRESLHRRLLAGLLTGLLGIGLISIGEWEGFGADVGALFILGAAMLQALFFVLQKPPLARYGPLPLMASATWVGAIVLVPFLPSLLEQVSRAPPSTTLAVAYLGLLPGAVAYATWAYVLSRLPASAAAPFLYAVPVVATVIAWVWLGETPRPLVVAGGLVVIAAVTLSRWRPNAAPERTGIDPHNRGGIDMDTGDERIPDFLQHASLRRLIRIDAGFEGSWSETVQTIWAPEEGFLGFDGVIHGHPTHRPAIEFLFPEGWIGVRCYVERDGQHVLDEERATFLVDLAARRREQEQG